MKIVMLGVPGINSKYRLHLVKCCYLELDKAINCIEMTLKLLFTQRLCKPENVQVKYRSTLIL